MVRYLANWRNGVLHDGKNFRRIGLSYQQEPTLTLITPFLLITFSVPKKDSHVFDFRYRNNRFTP